MKYYTKRANSYFKFALLAKGKGTSKWSDAIWHMGGKRLALLLCLIPCHRSEKSARELRNSHNLITKSDNIHARTHATCVDQRGYMTSGWRHFSYSKNRETVPYHRCAWILRSPSPIMAPDKTNKNIFTVTKISN